MARYVHGRPLTHGRVGVLASAFNPPTIAHVALAEAARAAAGLDQVAFALPKQLPHKTYEEATFEQRLEMLRALAASREEWACVVTDGGLFVEMAREVKGLSGPRSETLLLCGRDAAERIVAWDYQDSPPFEEQLREFGMVVAARVGQFEPPREWAERFTLVSLPEGCADVSSSAVREALRSGRPWEEMVPSAVAQRVRSLGLYRPDGQG